jgi:radical SAM superfamily enzyme YgiQ (UPF0313 family)
MTPDLLALARRAGCRHLHYGFESGSERMLDLMGRDYSPAQAREVLAATKAAGIETRINLMVGFPGETDETVGETIAFVRENAGIIDLVDTVNPVYLMAMSDLYEHRGEYGIETPDEIPDNWVDGRLDQPTRENWVLRVIHELRAAGVRNNLGVSRSFQCSSGDTVR